MTKLSEQIDNLENKAACFDDAVERIVALKSEIEAFENGDYSQKGPINSFKRLISFYEPKSRAYKERLEADGYQLGALEKYVDSTFYGERIQQVKVMKAGDIFAITESGEHLIGCLDDDCNFMQGLDYLLCGVQDADGLILIK